jgi:Ca2+-binding EF-hand superfamily protein
LRCPLINRITIKELREQFNKSDRDGDGLIKLGWLILKMVNSIKLQIIIKEDLQQILEEYADFHNEDAIEAMFEAADRVAANI